MLRIVAMAAAAVLSAVGAAKAVVALDGGPAQAQAAPRAQGTDAAVAKGADGHYWAEANVNGGRVRFLVDTGATVVALSADDAARLGFSPASLDYAYQVTTANGQARAARVKLASVAVAGAQVRDVDAFVIDKGLQTSLLGMSYLGRLSGFEATPAALILRP